MGKSCCSITQMTAVNGTLLPLPRHVEHLVGMLYLRSGSGVLEGDAPVQLEGGFAVVYPASRSWQFTAQENVSLLVCTFSQEQPPCGLLFRDCRTMPDVQQLLPQLDTLMVNPHSTEGLQAAIRILSCLLGHPEPEGAEIPAYLRAARQIIDEFYYEDLTLEILALRVGRSKFHLSRAFREWYQMTPNTYLTSVRLRRAEELLTRTQLPAREVGEQVGLTNTAYFTALFKRRYGLPPREYRMAKQAAILK